MSAPSGQKVEKQMNDETFNARTKMLRDLLTKPQQILDEKTGQEDVDKANITAQTANGCILLLIAEELHSLNKQMAEANAPKFSK